MHSTQLAGKAAASEFELSAARLEVELCHRALALLRLQLSSAQEDVEQLQVICRYQMPCCPDDSRAG